MRPQSSSAEGTEAVNNRRQQTCSSHWEPKATRRTRSWSLQLVSALRAPPLNLPAGSLRTTRSHPLATSLLPSSSQSPPSHKEHLSRSYSPDRSPALLVFFAVPPAVPAALLALTVPPPSRSLVAVARDRDVIVSAIFVPSQWSRRARGRRESRAGRGRRSVE